MADRTIQVNWYGSAEGTAGSRSTAEEGLP